MRYLVRFQDGEEKEMPSTQLNIVSFMSEVEDEIKVRQVEMIPEVVEELGCYHLVSVSQHSNKQGGLDKKLDQLVINQDPDQQEIEDVVLDDE